MIHRIAVLLAVVAVPLAISQAAEFEVASVRLVKRAVGPHAVGLRPSHGRITIEAATLRQMIGLAYRVQRVLVQGGPSWYDSEMYDVVAKAESADATVDQMRPMLQTLLADRFKLAVH